VAGAGHRLCSVSRSVRFSHVSGVRCAAARCSIGPAPGASIAWGALDLVPAISPAAVRPLSLLPRADSWRYPRLEFLTAVLFVAVALEIGPTWDNDLTCLFVAVLVCCVTLHRPVLAHPRRTNPTGILMALCITSSPFL